jgi:aspartate-semialdehyde dehydrogenase
MVNKLSSPRVGVFGATGAVGKIVCQLLESREFPFHSIRFFGSPENSLAGKRQIHFCDKPYPVEPLIEERVHDLDIVIASTPDEVAKECASWVVRQGGILIDESAAHRMLADVPLVIPEVNPGDMSFHKGIIASPNCSTTQMVVCLKPLHDAFGLKRVVVSTYQAASGAGQAALNELLEGTRAAASGEPHANKFFESPLPLNLWPKIGGMREEGYTSEELKMIYETRKILELPELAICPTCVRVPVAHCHSESIVVETVQPVDLKTAREVLASFPGIVVVDDPGHARLPTPRNCEGRDEVFVGRLRRDLSVPNGIAFWCVSDNLRKGAATNAVQIAEHLIRRSAL